MALKGRLATASLRDPARGTSQLYLRVLMKPSMFGRDIRERLLNDGVCNRGNLLALLTVNKGIKNKLRMSYK